MTKLCVCECRRPCNMLWLYCKEITFLVRDESPHTRHGECSPSDSTMIWTVCTHVVYSGIGRCFWIGGLETEAAKWPVIIFPHKAWKNFGTHFQLQKASSCSISDYMHLHHHVAILLLLLSLAVVAACYGIVTLAGDDIHHPMAENTNLLVH